MLVHLFQPIGSSNIVEGRHDTKYPALLLGYDVGPLLKREVFTAENPGCSKNKIKK